MIYRNPQPFRFLKLRLHPSRNPLPAQPQFIAGGQHSESHVKPNFPFFRNGIIQQLRIDEMNRHRCTSLSNGIPAGGFGKVQILFHISRIRRGDINQSPFLDISRLPPT